MSEIIRYLSFSDSFCSSSIHIVANGKLSFFLMVELYSIVYMSHIFFIHSSGDGHLGYFRNLAIVDNAAIKSGYMCLFESAILYPLDKYLVVQFLHCGVFYF